jgi:hypothetical protein
LTRRAFCGRFLEWRVENGLRLYAGQGKTATIRFFDGNPDIHGGISGEVSRRQRKKVSLPSKVAPGVSHRCFLKLLFLAGYWRNDNVMGAFGVKLLPRTCRN